MFSFRSASLDDDENREDPARAGCILSRVGRGNNTTTMIDLNWWQTHRRLEPLPLLGRSHVAPDAG